VLRCTWKMLRKPRDIPYDRDTVTWDTGSHEG
jgi:hypothetical protein